MVDFVVQTLPKLSPRRHRCSKNLSRRPWKSQNPIFGSHCMESVSRFFLQESERFIMVLVVVFPVRFLTRSWFVHVSLRVKAHDCPRTYCFPNDLRCRYMHLSLLSVFFGLQPATREEKTHKKQTQAGPACPGSSALPSQALGRGFPALYSHVLVVCFVIVLCMLCVFCRSQGDCPTSVYTKQPVFNRTATYTQREFVIDCILMFQLYVSPLCFVCFMCFAVHWVIAPQRGTPGTLTYKVLRRECKERGLATWGSKEEL